MRVLFALVVAAHMPETLAHHSMSQPNGLARLLDLRFLLNDDTLALLRYVLWAALVLYVLRVGWAIVLPYMALLSVATGSVNNSQGAISHGLQIVSLVLVAQCCAHYYSRFTRDPATEAAGENRMIFWSQQAIVATYLVSALTKLINSSGMWFFQAPYIAVQVVKTTEQSYYNRLDENARASGLELAAWIVAHPLLVIAMLSAGFLLEFLAPVALLGRRFALLIGLSLIAFHESIARLMKLHFEYNEYLVAIYLVNAPFWLMSSMRWWRSRAAARTTAA